jgi:hypothetical protein
MVFVCEVEQVCHRFGPCEYQAVREGSYVRGPSCASGEKKSFLIREKSC